MRTFVRALVFLFSIFMSMPVFAWKADTVYIDVLYLKNGDVVQGDIENRGVDSIIRIRKWTGAVRTFEAEEMDSFVRQGIEVPNDFSPRIPILAGFCSYIFPGGGQYYNREYEKGLAFTAASVAGLAMMIQSMDVDRDGLLLAGTGLFVGSWVASMVEASLRSGYLDWLYLGETFCLTSGFSSNWRLRPGLISSDMNKSSISRRYAAPGLSLCFSF